MKQYKLISEYPGSPKLGTIHWFKIDEFGPSSNSIWQGTNFYDSHPKYWQKVEEVDYEILSFIRIDSTCVPKDSIGILFELQEDGLFGTYNKYSFHSEKQMLEGKYSVKTGFFAIHSVKRLSDGEVFTIKDFTTKGQIHKFEIILNILSVSVGDQKTLLRTFDKLPKKTPLFTTEDGVEIFEGDKFYYPNIHIWKTIISEADKRVLIFIRLNKYKPFSTKEKSEEYILLNKPCLSLMDLLRVREDAGMNKPFPLFEKLEELAKSKL